MTLDDKLQILHSQNEALEFVLISLQVFTIGLILVLGLRKDKKILKKEAPTQDEL